MNNSNKFDDSLQSLALFAKAIAHPARLAILQHLAESPGCVSGDISKTLPLSRSTVSQHLQELKKMGLIHGEISGLNINYCLCGSNIEKYLQQFTLFFNGIDTQEKSCSFNAR